MRLRNKTFSSCVAGIVLASFVFVQLSIPLKARALPLLNVPTDATVNPITKLWDTISSTEWLLRYIVNPATRVVLRAAIVATTQQIVGWIKGDGGKNVGYVANFETALQRELDVRAGEFLNSLTKFNLCGDIGAFLRLSLQAPGFSQQIGCSITDIVANVQDFFIDFERGGWQAFMQMNYSPKNNPTGAYLIALDAQLKGEAARFSSFVEPLKKSFPFKGFEVDVKECYIDDDTETETCSTKKEVRTPGQLISDNLSKSTGIGLDFAANAKDWDEAIATLVNALIGSIISSSMGSGGGFIGGSLSYGDEDTSGEVIPSKAELQKGTDNATYLADTIITSADTNLLTYRRDLFSTRQQIAACGCTPEQKQALEAKEADFEATVADMENKKQTVLARQGDLYHLKEASFIAASPDDIKRIDDQVAAIHLELDGIAKQIPATPQSPVATGSVKTDHLMVIKDAESNVNGSITILNETIAEINRLLTSPGVPRRSELEAKKTEAETKITNLQIKLSELQRQEALLQSVLTDAEAYAYSAGSLPSLYDSNGENKIATSLIQSIDPLLDVITPPPPPPPPSEEPPPPPPPDDGDE